MQVQEKTAWRVNGFGVLLGALAVATGLVVALAICGAIAGQYAAAEEPPPVASVVVSVAAMIAWVPWFVAVTGFTIVQPNQARVVVFFGRYAGTIRDAGLWWTWPLTTRQNVSLRVRNFHSDKLKVNDHQGNPIEIGAVIVWSVVDSARAVFDVDAYASFVSIQSETAIRAIASHFPYDAHDGEASLRGSPDEVAQRLRDEVQQRLEVAGVKVHDTRISHLAYAPEIAQAMLRRQQAHAIIAARQQIVEGAVGMVGLALKKLAEEGVVSLDEERKAAMVSNLLVVLVGEAETQPIVNAGTLF